MLKTELRQNKLTRRTLFGIFLVAAAISIPCLANAANGERGEDSIIISSSTNWSGYYFGVHTGIGAFTGMAIDWGQDAFGSPDGDFDQNAFGGIFGIQAGFNKQVGNIIYGLETDIAKTGFSEDRFFDDPNPNYVKSEMEWLATIRGRLGVSAGNAMAYVTAGLAIAQLDHCANDEAPCLINDDNVAWDGIKLGLVAGVGVEAALSENWSIKGEYLFVQMDKENIVYDPGEARDIDFSNRLHLVRLGLNYHLNGLNTAPVVSGGPWSGFYGGVHAGIGAFTGMTIDWHDDALSSPDGDLDQNAFGSIFGIQAGFNKQVGNIVYGLEADIAKTGFSEDRFIDNNTEYVKSEMEWLATIRGRLGMSAGNAMTYVTAGLAIAQLDHCANDDVNAPCSNDDEENIAWAGVKLGLVAGVGVEAALSENWSIKGEYLFVQMDKENIVYDTGNNQDIDFSNRLHLVRLGLNYHLNGLNTAPVVSGGPWSGFYGGVHAGIGAFTGMTIDWHDDALSSPDGDLDQNAFGSIFGIQAGFNKQVGNIVYGLEADIAKTGFSEDRFIDNNTEYVKSEMEWLATIRGRLGMSAGNAMTYVTAGLAIAQLDHCANDDVNAPCSNDDEENIAWDGVKLGLVAGVGVEAALSENWSIKGEYLFVQMDKENIVYDTGNNQDIDFSNRLHLVRLGLNYKLGMLFNN